MAELILMIYGLSVNPMIVKVPQPTLEHCENARATELLLKDHLPYGIKLRVLCKIISYPA